MRPGKVFAGTLLGLSLCAGLLYACAQGRGTPPPSALTLRPPAGWRPATSTPEQEILLARFQRESGMELKSRLVSSDRKSLLAVYVRPLAINSSAPAALGEVMQALADVHHLSPCSPAAGTAADRFSACLAPLSLPMPAAAALVVPERQDRYFILLAMAPVGGNAPQVTLGEVLRQTRVTAH